jgi:hypothetical protein
VRAEAPRPRTLVRRVLIAAALCSLPASLNAAVPAPKSRGPECNLARSHERAQPAPAKTRAAQEAAGGSTEPRWFSFFRRQSSALQP